MALSQSEMLLEIVTPDKKVLEEKVHMLIVKGSEGELGILPNHIPLVTPLQVGPAIARSNGQDRIVAVNGGFLEVRKDRVTILAESAELPEDIDKRRAEEAKRRAEERLSKRHQDEVDFLRAERALQRALNRIRLSR